MEHGGLGQASTTEAGAGSGRMRRSQRTSVGIIVRYANLLHDARSGDGHPLPFGGQFALRHVESLRRGVQLGLQVSDRGLGIRQRPFGTITGAFSTVSAASVATRVCSTVSCTVTADPCCFLGGIPIPAAWRSFSWRFLYRHGLGQDDARHNPWRLLGIGLLAGQPSSGRWAAMLSMSD